MRLFVTASLTEQIAGVRVGRHYLTIAGPKREPLFSERHGHLKVLRLFGGWRLRLRADALSPPSTKE